MPDRDRARDDDRVPRGSDFRVRVHSEAMGEMAEFSLEAEIAKSGPGWGLDAGGVAEALRRRGVGGGLRRGMDAGVASDVPVGAGLSSSAVLEVATGLALLAVNGAEMNRVELRWLASGRSIRMRGCRAGSWISLFRALGSAGGRCCWIAEIAQCGRWR